MIYDNVIIQKQKLKANCDWLEASGRHAATALVRLNIDFPTKARKPGKPQAPSPVEDKKWRKKYGTQTTKAAILFILSII